MSSRRFVACIILAAVLFSVFAVVTVAQGKYCGSKKSDIYHYPSCKWAKEIHSYNLVWFKDENDAAAKGYRPCQVCRPPGPSSTPTYTTIRTMSTPNAQESYLTYRTLTTSTYTTTSVMSTSLSLLAPLLAVSGLIAGLAFLYQRRVLCRITPLDKFHSLFASFLLSGWLLSR